MHRFYVALTSPLYMRFIPDFSAPLFPILTLFLVSVLPLSPLVTVLMDHVGVIIIVVAKVRKVDAIPRLVDALALRN
jgi:hypothetical protein